MALPLAIGERSGMRSLDDAQGDGGERCGYRGSLCFFSGIDTIIMSAGIVGVKPKTVVICREFS
ncbi:MAG: hypothetical protein LBM23_06570 [Propionibacteriaceae bacterium]|nr:hypothetical protein [Propionibacteriaceae bacterium]